MELKGKGVQEEDDVYGDDAGGNEGEEEQEE